MLLLCRMKGTQEWTIDTRSSVAISPFLRGSIVAFFTTPCSRLGLNQSLNMCI
jgi:hypothetical protein